MELYICDETPTQNVTIFGINFHGLILAHYLQSLQKCNVVMTDNDSEKVSKQLPFNLSSRMPKDIDANNTCIITALKEEYKKEISAQLKDYGCTKIGFLNEEAIKVYENNLSDDIYINCQWYIKEGTVLDLKHPKTFNEKLQWLKIYDQKPDYKKMVDKLSAKEYAATLLGSKYVIPTIRIWDNVEEISFDALPQSFVLKCSHDSGSVVVVKDKSKADLYEIKEKMKSSFSRDYYYVWHEWVYKGICPKVYAEPYLVDESKNELKDYKVFNFNGEPKLIQVDFGRFSEHKRNLYTTKWDFINTEFQYPSDNNMKISRPDVLDEMLECSKQLSQDKIFVRTDFYCIGMYIYFGEMTFYPEAGFGKFSSHDFAVTLGDWCKLPISF